uniref:C-X-C motif chemokine 11-like n=1 Tax=Astyanax mexicanus TaxID=7994 RepID=A0A3B1IG02_ASTMX
MKATAVILLFLVIFGITATLCAGRIGGQGERCLCKGKLAKRVKPQEIKKIELFHMSASCPKTEILITHKKGKKFCLDPNGKQGMKVLQSKMRLHREKKPKAHGGGKKKKQKKSQQQQQQQQ